MKQGIQPLFFTPFPHLKKADKANWQITPSPLPLRLEFNRLSFSGGGSKNPSLKILIWQA
jgi:hypothetical protein